MRKYTISFQFLIIITILFGLTISHVFSFDYQAKMNENDSIIWKCNICNEEKINQIFGPSWRDEFEFLKEIEEGARMKWKIRDIANDATKYSEKTKNYEGAVKISFEYWSWTMDDWTHQSTIQQDSYFKNPNNHPDDYIFPDYVPFWFPAPTREYLTELDPILYDGYDVDITYLLTIACEIEAFDPMGGNPSEYIKIMSVYDDQGILSSYKLYLNNHFVVIDISLDSKFVYQLPVFISLVVLFSVITIYFYKKI